MRQTFHSQGLFLSLLFIFVLSSYSARATRLLQPKEGIDKVKMNGVSQKGHSEDAWNLMGLEKCENGDEECLKRRALADAHLDYIYTQHHKP